jgi:hypothetical protein
MASTESIDLSDYTTVLATHEEEYWLTIGDDRLEVVQTIIQEMVEESNGSLSEDIINGLDKVSQLVQPSNPEISPTWTQKIMTWYSNHKLVEHGDGSTLVRVGTIWNWRLVVQHLHKEEIAALMAKTGLTHTDKAWIKNHQLSTNTVIETLGGNDKMSEKYGEVAKSWNTVEPPDELKRK